MRHKTKLDYGIYGATYESGTTARTCQWNAIYVVDTCKFDTLTMDPAVDGDSTVIANGTAGSADEIPEGTWIYGKITVFELHSGAVIAYKDGSGTALS